MARLDEMHRADRPRERLARRGAQALGDDELLALVLGTGYSGRSALEVAAALNKSHPRGGLARLGLAELATLKGMGASRAAALQAALELGRRWEGRDAPGEALDRPEAVWGRLQDLRGRRKEHFVAFYLNACNRVLHQETVSVGTLTASLVHPREVFSPALERAAASLIVAHNHPSGDPRPSAEDREVTRRLLEAGRLLGIPVLDHVVAGDRGFFSFREHGLMD